MTWGVAEASKLVDAVRSAGGQVPIEFEQPPADAGREAWDKWKNAMWRLAIEASRAFTKHDAWQDLTDDGRARRRARDLGTVRGMSLRLKKKLERLQSEKGGDAALLSRIDAALPAEYPAAIDFLDALLSSVEGLEAQIGYTAPIFGASTTAQGLLIRSLADVYARNFATSPEADMKKSYENYNGPFPAFVLSALATEGKPMTPATLTVALQRHFTR